MQKRLKLLARFKPLLQGFHCGFFKWIAAKKISSKVKLPPVSWKLSELIHTYLKMLDFKGLY